MKNNYRTPVAEISVLNAENILCASGADGSNEDFNKGTGFTPDLFDFAKPF